MQREGEIAAPKGDDFLKLNCKNVFRNTDTSMGFFRFQTVETLSFNTVRFRNPRTNEFRATPHASSKIGTAQPRLTMPLRV